MFLFYQYLRRKYLFDEDGKITACMSYDLFLLFLPNNEINNIP